MQKDLELFPKEKVMTTKELAETLGVDVKTVNNSVERLLGNTFQKSEIKTISNGGRPTKIFTEEQATLIKQEIQKHHNLTNRQIDTVSTEYEENQTIANAISILQRRANEYKQRMEVAEAVVNRIASSNGLKTIQETADILGYGSSTYFDLLRGKGIIFKDKKTQTNLPKREYLDSGYFEVKEEPYERNGKTFLYTRIFVTAKGLLWLEKKTPRRA